MPANPRLKSDAPLLKHRQEQVRAQIQATKLITSLQEIALGLKEFDPKVAAVQVRAATTLLAKTLPDLSSVSLTGEDGGPLQVLVQTLPTEGE